MDFRNAASGYAQQYGIPPDLFLRLVQQESSWRPQVVSPAGAIGLAQLMPGTARELGVDPNDPMQNLEGGARYLRQQYDRFGSWPLALAAYNAGPGRVASAGGIPNISETQNYVNRVWGGFNGSTEATPMVMNPDPQPQRMGFFGNLFGGGQPQQPAAADPTSTDPFANLSRSQRTMLGFAALRDAAASLEGRDSNYFGDALGGFEAARERERLRAQGLFANQVQALQALGEIERQISIASDQGFAPSPAQVQLRDMLYASVYGDGGVPAAPSGVTGGAAMPAPVAAPSDFTGGAMPPGTPTGPQGVTGAPPTGVVYEPDGVTPAQYTGEPEVAPAAAPAPAPATNGGAANEIATLEQEVADFDARIGRIVANGGDPRALVDQRDRRLDRIEQLREEQAAAGQRQTAAEITTPQTVNTLETVQDLRQLIADNPGRTTGFFGSILQNVPGSTANDARALSLVIRANTGFDQLTALRAASPTGGALGGVSAPELDALQSSIGNLDLTQSAEQVLDQIDNIERQYMRIIRRAYETSEDPAALDRALGGRPSFLVDDGAGDAGAGMNNGDIPQITTDAEYNALPSGAQFVAPDGTIRRKP